MAKFLDTMGVNSALSQIIKNAQERLVLISPYLQINDRFKVMLEDKDKFKIDIRIIYSESRLQPSESNWLKSLKSVRLSICKNLHAKCYLNEEEAIVTSMNFYEFSQINNYEMGILVSKTDDSQLYTDINDEAKNLLRMSEDESDFVSKRLISKDESNKKEQATIEGFCIRCGTRIKLDPEHPYCLADFQQWKKFSDKTTKKKKESAIYVENQIHHQWINQFA